MALTVYFHNVDKKTNSTWQPKNENALYVTDVVLKTPTNITGPELQVSNYPHELINANYCWIPSLSRFYYITDIEFTSNNILTIKTKVDVLASFKNAILADYQYITRSSVKKDSSIEDSLYPALTGARTLENNFVFVDDGTSTTSRIYILGLVGQTMGFPAITGAAQYVYLNSSQLQDLMDFLFTPENFGDMIVDNVVKTFFNPFQYVVSCRLQPFKGTSFPTTGQALKLGWFEPGIECSVCVNGWAYKTGAIVPENNWEEIDIPRPVSSDIDDYRNYAPYAHYRLYIPFIGWTDIEPALLHGATKLRLFGVVDEINGELMMRVETDTGNVVTYLSGYACPEIQLAQVSVNESQVTAATSAIGGGLTGFGEFIKWANREKGREHQRALGEGLASLGQGVASLSGQISSIGSTGNLSSRVFENRVRLVCNYYETVPQNNAEFGSPYCVHETLSEHAGGFVQCLNPHVTGVNMLESEISECESYLTGGIFLE